MYVVFEAIRVTEGHLLEQSETVLLTHHKKINMKFMKHKRPTFKPHRIIESTKAKMELLLASFVSFPNKRK